MTNGTGKPNLKHQQNAPQSNPRKKSNIFRRVSKLKKISEENLSSNEKIKIGDVGEEKIAEVPLLRDNGVKVTTALEATNKSSSNE